MAACFLCVCERYLFMAVHEQWDPANAGVYAAMLAGGVAGLGIGNALAPRVDVACLQRYLTVFLAMVRIICHDLDCCY